MLAAKRFLVLILIFGVFLIDARPQTSTSLPKVEPFAISPGKSFSASKSKPTASKNSSNSAISLERIPSDFKEALEIIQKNHVTGANLDTDGITKSAINSMLHALDPHSNYFDRTEFQELLGEHRSEYTGTGSTIASFVRNGVMETFVVSVIAETPAGKANLRFGDHIVAVDGEEMSGRTSVYVRDKVRGPRGTFVTLKVERAENRAIETIRLRRDRVPQRSIEDSMMLNGNVGYIDMTNGFSYTTYEEMEAALKKLARLGLTSLILDLRGNPGGIFDQAVRVSEKFLDADSVIVTQRGRYSAEDRTWRSLNRSPNRLPLVLLVDGDSASAAEIVAGALQDNDRALILGSKTFGKGLVQNVVPLASGSGLTLTAAKYYTPSGRSIQRDYSDGHLYDYFKHTNKAAMSERSVYASRTKNNRIVYGGDGITPDEIIGEDELTQAQIRLLDPVFFFVRDYVAGRIAGDSRLSDRRAQLRQRIIFGDSPLNENIFNSFRAFVEKNDEWKLEAADVEKNEVFVRSRLRYSLSLAAFGSDAANRSRIEDDPVVAKAINAIPKAANLNSDSKAPSVLNPASKKTR
ncbi:MAG: S41 family peptidase [Blastocatellia bacterium]